MPIWAYVLRIVLQICPPLVLWSFWSLSPTQLLFDLQGVPIFPSFSSLSNCVLRHLLNSLRICNFLKIRETSQVGAGAKGQWHSAANFSGEGWCEEKRCKAWVFRERNGRAGKWGARLSLDALSSIKKLLFLGGNLDQHQLENALSVFA